MQRRGGAMMRLSWQQFDSACDVLSRRLSGGTLANIYGVPRGGLPLAVALSNALHLPLILSDEASVRLSPASLIVDDIADHGVTIERLRKRFGPLRAAVWVQRDRAAHLENIESVIRVVDDEWILFPWGRVEHAGDDEARFRALRGQ